MVGRRVLQNKEPHMSSGNIKVTRLVVLGLKGDCRVDVNPSFISLKLKRIILNISNQTTTLV